MNTRFTKMATGMKITNKFALLDDDVSDPEIEVAPPLVKKEKILTPQPMKTKRIFTKVHFKTEEPPSHTTMGKKGNEIMEKNSKKAGSPGKKQCNERTIKKNTHKHGLELLTHSTRGNNIGDVLKTINKVVHHIPRDGNCIYNAVCHQVRNTYPTLTGQSLREIVCNHLIENDFYYKNFIVLNPSESFQQMITCQLKRSRAWNNSLGDLLPLAIANLFQCKLKIFSTGQIPIIKVQPSLPHCYMHHPGTIQLVRYADHGCEHYDSCVDTR